MKLPFHPRLSVHRALAETDARSRVEKNKHNQLTRGAVGFLGLAVIALAGCSATRPRSTCEPMVAEICSRAADAQLHDGTLMVDHSPWPKEARLDLLVVPVVRQDGVLATEVDCYANTDSRTYSIVQSDLAIAPKSQASVDFLRDRGLCADEGSYAKNEHQRVVTASARSSYR